MLQDINIQGMSSLATLAFLLFGAIVTFAVWTKVSVKALEIRVTNLEKSKDNIYHQIHEDRQETRIAINEIKLMVQNLLVVMERKVDRPNHL